jgi:cytochrome c oxidase subunit 3
LNLWVALAGLLGGLTAWALLVRRLHTRSWESHGVVELPPATTGDIGALAQPPARIGLWVFLGVITSLFGLFIAAYFMRMGYGHGAGHGISDWHSVPKPPILWFNTGLLLASSAAMQLARGALRAGRRAWAGRYLFAGGALALIFLTGQLVAWRQLQIACFYMTTGPASAFFYVLTAVHGLHLVGGLVVWLRTVQRLWVRAAELIDVRMSIELCTTYWHYLLLVWIVLYGLLLAT